MERAEEEDARVAFQRLKPIATDLMECRNNAQGARKALAAMRDGLLHVPPDGLQACQELVLFPLYLILEAVLVGRMTPETDGKETGIGDMRCATNEGVAEEVFACYQTLLEHTWCEGREPMQQALARAAGVATVCQKSDSETVRKSGLRCLSALILHLRKSPLSKDLHACLCDATSAPALGHLISIPVSYAKSEIHAGTKGSKSVLQFAWATLQEWLEFVDDPDAIAFFVPGTASGLFLTLQRAGSMGPTTASAGGLAVVEAVCALNILLQLVLADSRCKHALADFMIQRDSEAHVDVVQQLHKLARQSKQDTYEKCDGGAETEEFHLHERNQNQSLRCVRDQHWLCSTAQKIGDMVKQTIPLLSHHAHVSVRSALINLCATILNDCAVAMSACREVCVRCLLVLAHDSFEATAKHAKDTLRASMFHTNPSCATCTVVSSILQKALADLPPAGDPEPSHLEENLKLTASCMEALEAEQLVFLFLQSDDARSQLLDLLVGCFCFEGDLRAALGTSWQAGHHESATRLQLLGASCSHVSGISLYKAHQQPLPRFAQGMTYLSTPSLYGRAATVLRLLGRAAAAMQHSGSELAGLLGCARRKVAFEIKTRAHGWQRDAASWFLVINELLYGASGAWNIDKACGQFASRDWTPATTDELISQIVPIMELYAQPELINAPTKTDETRGVSLREAANNCVMLRPLLEGVGIFAGCLGPCFANVDARLLPVAICPLVERVADTSAFVADSAMVSILAVCKHCGYETPQEMLSKNADYVVDELCKQLREPRIYPRSCQLLTAVLRSLDDTSSMFPLVAEPVRLASLMLTPLARRQNENVSNHTLMALREATKATVQEGRKVQGFIKSECEHVLETAANENSKPDQASTMVDAIDSISESAEEFFLKHHQSKQEESAASMDIKLEACQDLLARWRKRLENIATISDTVVETVGPLFASASLSAKGLAMECAIQTLHAAHSYDQAIDSIENMAERIIDDHTKDLDVPKRILLPYIAQLWPDLVQSLNEGQGASIESSLTVLLEMVSVSRATFLARRWIQDAWPACLRLLNDGRSVRSAGLVHADYLAVRQQERSPVSDLHIENVRRSVLSLVEAIATGPSASKVLIPENIGKMAIDLLAYGTLPYSLQVQTQSINTVLKLALVDRAKVESALIKAATIEEDCSRPTVNHKTSRSSELQRVPAGRISERQASVAKLVLSSLQDPITEP